ncbi:hypothetical protein ACE38W_14815 [Chitinophaga sp. Hz27]|uniref:hypothetical protein n=1 Tax=Chitinophaga sp. Hz27 TaxID=3347169 RepID=UPI0035DA4634
METITTKTFEEIKDFIVRRGKQFEWCEGQANRMYNASSIHELLEVIKDNIAWIASKQEGLADILEELFGTELLFFHNIYTSGKHHLSIDKPAYIVTLGSSSATVETLDSSSATVETLGSSSATVETLGSSSATVKTWGSSSATVKTLDSSSATVKTLDSSSATVKTLGSSSTTVKTLDSSSATVETLGSSSATVETWGSSSKLTYSLGDGPCPSIKHLSERKLFVKTSDFEIVQVQ